MKRIGSINWKYVLIVGICLGLGSNQIYGRTVSIPDPELRAAILKALGKPSDTDELTDSDLESLVVLDASRSARGKDQPRISSLEGLEYAKNLVRLDLSGLPNTGRGIDGVDFSVLESLPQLRELIIQYGSVWSETSFDELRLPNLEKLDLTNNSLILSSFLDGFPGLVELSLEFNRFEDFVVPPNLKNLERLTVGSSKLINFKISGADSHLRELDIKALNRLKSIELPDRLDHLEVLRLEALKRSPVTTFKLPSMLPNLRELTLFHFSSVAGVQFPVTSPKLKLMDIQNAAFEVPIIDVSDAASLEFFRLAGTNIERVELPLKALELAEIFIHGNSVQEIELPLEAPNLNDLFVQLTSVERLSIPEGATFRDRLSVAGNAALSRIDVWGSMIIGNDLSLGGSILGGPHTIPGREGLVSFSPRGNPLQYVSFPQDGGNETMFQNTFEKDQIRYHGPPIIDRRSGGEIELNWKAGRLQMSDQVGGAWTDVEGGQSPFTVDQGLAPNQRFFRVITEW